MVQLDGTAYLDGANGGTQYPDRPVILPFNGNEGQRDAVVNGLAQHGIEVRAVDREAAGRGRPVVMTMHRAKGLEFRKVLLFDVSKNAIPRPLRDQQYSDADGDDALLRERSLLYVAATRARDQLAISWSGEASPLITALAP